MSPLRKPLILRTVPSSAFTLLEIRTYIEQNVNANSRIYGRVIHKSDKMKGVFDIGTFRSGLMNREFDTFGLVLRMRSMVYSSKDFESLWFLYQAEGLPKNISIEELTFPSVVELNLQHKSSEFMK